MGFGRYFNGGNIVQMAVALSLMRPDSQSYLGPTAVVPNQHPYNMTNAVFNPMPMSPGGTSVDRFSAAKEAAAENDQDPLSRFLDWHVNKNHFNNDAVAMLFEGGPPCPPRGPLASDSESGYSSSEGVLSPSAPTNTEPCADLSELGAAGYTPPRSTAIESPHGMLDLDDFLDLSAIEHIPAVKTELLSPMLGLDGVPDVKLFSENTCLAPTRDQYSPCKGSLEEIDLQPSFEFDVDTLYDPFSIDPTIESLQFPNEGTGIDDLDFDFDFPPDILTPIVGEDNPEEDFLGQVLIPEYRTPSIGSEVLSEFSAEESLSSVSDAAFRYAPSATDMRVLKQEVTESSRLLTDLPTNATKGSKGTLPTFSRLSRLPISDSRLIDLPVNDFNELVLKLSDEDAQHARDVRRRGKNKEAARLCRKRKIEAIGGLDIELLKLQEEKDRIMDERHQLQEETLLWKNKLAELEGYVFKSLRDDNGLPLSPREYSLFQGSNGNVYVGKDINAKRPKKSGLNNRKAGK